MSDAGSVPGRLGLLRTMVFTHLPSNVLLAAVAFAPSLSTGDRALARPLRSLADGHPHPAGVRRRRRRSKRADGHGCLHERRPHSGAPGGPAPRRTGGALLIAEHSRASTTSGSGFSFATSRFSPTDGPLSDGALAPVV